MSNREFLAELVQALRVLFHRHKWEQRGNMRRCSVCELTQEVGDTRDA